VRTASGALRTGSPSTWNGSCIRPFLKVDRRCTSTSTERHPTVGRHVRVNRRPRESGRWSLRISRLGETVRSADIASAHAGLSDRFRAATRLYLIKLGRDDEPSQQRRRGAALPIALRRSDASTTPGYLSPPTDLLAGPDPPGTGCAQATSDAHACFLADRRARTTDQHVATRSCLRASSPDSRRKMGIIVCRCPCGAASAQQTPNRL